MSTPEGGWGGTGRFDFSVAGPPDPGPTPDPELPGPTAPPRRRLRWIVGVIGALLVLAVAGGATWWWLVREDPGPTTMTASQAEELSAALTSAEVAELTSALDPALVDRMGTVSAPLLAGDLTITTSTFQLGEPGTGSVEASTEDDGWLVTLAWSGERWQVTGTVPR